VTKFDRNMFIVLGVTIALIVWVVISFITHRKRLLAECLNDGHKEYQCIGFLNGRSSIFIPMNPIPVRVGR